MKYPCVPVFPNLQQFPDSLVGKESTCNMRDLGSIPGLGRSPGEGESYPLQYSGLENSMDCIGLRVAKRWTRLSDFHFHFTAVPSWTKWEMCDSSGKAQRCPDSSISLVQMVLEQQTYVVVLDKEDRWHDIVPFNKVWPKQEGMFSTGSTRVQNQQRQSRSKILQWILETHDWS